MAKSGRNASVIDTTVTTCANACLFKETVMLKSWRHLLAAAKALNVVIKGQGRMAYVKEANGQFLFAMRYEVIESQSVVSFEQFVKKSREEASKQQATN